MPATTRYGSNMTMYERNPAKIRYKHGRDGYLVPAPVHGTWRVEWKKHNLTRCEILKELKFHKRVFAAHYRVTKRAMRVWLDKNKHIDKFPCVLSHHGIGVDMNVTFKGR